MRVYGVYIPLVLGALIWNVGAGAATWAACLAIGLALWTVVEYLMHRWVLHRMAPHYQHHGEPEKLEYIFAPLWLSGASAMAYEVVWSRALSMAIGSSLQSFALILVTFLLGIAGGSAVLSRLFEPRQRELWLLVRTVGVVVRRTGVA